MIDPVDQGVVPVATAVVTEVVTAVEVAAPRPKRAPHPQEDVNLLAPGTGTWQARRFDFAARVALAGLGGEDRAKLVQVANDRLAEWREENDVHPGLESERARAALAGVRRGRYADFLQGRRGYGEDTQEVARWIGAWWAAGAPDLDTEWVLEGRVPAAGVEVVG